MTLPATLDQPAPAPGPCKPGVLPDEFEVYVTDEDILLGLRHVANQCAIARAIRRTLRIKWRLSTSISVQPLGGAHIDGYPYDHDARDFIIAFDVGKPVEPRTVHFTAVR